MLSRVASITIFKNVFFTSGAYFKYIENYAQDSNLKYISILKYALDCKN